MTLPRASLNLLFLLVVSFCLATYMQPMAFRIFGQGQKNDLLKVVLGDSRRMFANHFFVEADVYFHSGYYPSFFQQSYQQNVNKTHLAEERANEKPDPEEERQMNFLGDPKNWIDDFGRHFYSAKHSHLDKPGAAREILPWLSLSAELDPSQIQTYTVAAYWLRMNMHKPDEAENFLRQGLRANPDSFEILFELGSLYRQDRNNPVMARNLWELALRRWHEQEAAGKKPEPLVEDGILAHLAEVEQALGNLPAALNYLELQLSVSPNPGAVQKDIDDLKKKTAGQTVK